MNPLDACCLFSGEPASGLPHQRVNKQAAAHSNAPMNTPYGQLHSQAFQRFAPGQDVLIHTIDKSAIQIEQESRPTASFAQSMFRPVCRPRFLIGGFHRGNQRRQWFAGTFLSLNTILKGLFSPNRPTGQNLVR